MAKKKLLIADDSRLHHGLYADDYIEKSLPLEHLARSVRKHLG